MAEENEQAQNTAGAETSQEETPTSETKTDQSDPENDSEAGESASQDAGQSTDDSASQETNDQKPNRAERRISKLGEKLADAKQQLASNSQPVVQDQSSQLPPWHQPAPQTDENGDIIMTREDLENTVAQVSDARIAQAREQDRRAAQAREIVQKFESDVKTIETKYPSLNPDSDQFDPKVSGKVAELYEKASNLNPALGLLEFVEGIQEVASITSDKSKSEVENSLVKQVAEGALAPGSTSKESKSSEDETLEEMEARLPKVR